MENGEGSRRGTSTQPRHFKHDVKDGDVSHLLQNGHPRSLQCSTRSWRELWLTRCTCRTRLGSSEGLIRVAEALLSVYSTFPPDVGKLKELLNALDPVTIAWLAHNLRQPVEGILNVDSVDLGRVVNLKAYSWEELHKFYKRQWKVVS